MTVPFEREIWDAAKCAELFGVKPAHFLRVIRYQPNFPEQLEFSKSGRPKWLAIDVSNWAMGEKSPSNPPPQEQLTDSVGS